MSNPLWVPKMRLPKNVRDTSQSVPTPEWRVHRQMHHYACQTQCTPIRVCVTKHLLPRE